MQSQFTILEFYGAANGTALNQWFNMDAVRGRKIVIKGIKVIPYYPAPGIDLTLTDGITVNNETVPQTARILRCFESYGNAVIMQLSLNGSQSPIFQNPFVIAGGGVANSWIDLDIDNIYYRFPEKLEAIDFSVNGFIFSDLVTGVPVQPSVRVFIQCYLQ